MGIYLLKESVALTDWTCINFLTSIACRSIID